MKVLISGADGMLGANIVRELLGRGDSVRALVIPNSPSKTIDGLDIEKIPCDITTDVAKIAEAAKGCDAMIHCAAITDQWAPPELTWKVNLDGTRNMLDGAVAAGIKRYVQIGSASAIQFGSLENPTDETAPFPPVYVGVPYAESKHASNELVRKYVKEKGLNAVIVCPTFMFGEFDARPSSGELILQFIKRQMKYTAPGGRSFAHTKNVAIAAVNALTKGRSGETYILGGVNMNYFDFFNKLASKTNRPPIKAVLPKGVIVVAGALASAFSKITGKKVAFNHTMAKLSTCGAYYDSSKATKELGLPPTDVDKAIEDAIKSLIDYGHLKL